MIDNCFRSQRSTQDRKLQFFSCMMQLSDLTFHLSARPEIFSSLSLYLRSQINGHYFRVCPCITDSHAKYNPNTGQHRNPCDNLNGHKSYINHFSDHIHMFSKVFPSTGSQTGTHCNRHETLGSLSKYFTSI